MYTTYAEPVQPKMEPYAELGEAEMKPRARQGRWGKLERKRGRGRQQSTIIPVFGRAANGVRMRVDEAIYMRPAGGKEALGVETQTMRERG